MTSRFGTPKKNTTIKRCFGDWFLKIFKTCSNFSIEGAPILAPVEFFSFDIPLMVPAVIKAVLFCKNSIFCYKRIIKRLIINYIAVMETTLNKDLGRIFWNSRSRATVLFTFLVEICDSLENLTLNRKSFQDAFLWKFFSRNYY